MITRKQLASLVPHKGTGYVHSMGISKRGEFYATDGYTMGVIRTGIELPCHLGISMNDVKIALGTPAMVFSVEEVRGEFFFVGDTPPHRHCRTQVYRSSFLDYTDILNLSPPSYISINFSHLKRFSNIKMLIPKERETLVLTDDPMFIGFIANKDPEITHQEEFL